MAFHEQFYRVEPQMTINDMVEMKQYEHESTKDFMMRFRKTMMRCQIPLRKKFYDVQFNELHELVITATKYEKLLTEEQQVKHSSKVPHFYKNKAPIHQLEFEGLEAGENNNSLGEGIELCAAKMTTPFKPLMVKELVQPIKDKKIVMNDGGFVPIRPQKYQLYFFDLTMVTDIYIYIYIYIYEELVKARNLEGKKYCKIHYTFNQSIANCVQFRDWIHYLIIKGKLLLEKPQANMMIDTDPFLEALINMINLNWVESGKGKVIFDGRGEIREARRPTEGNRRVVLCNICQCQCELEVPASGAIIDWELVKMKGIEEQDAHLSNLQATEANKENTKNPKNLSEVFRNFEASEKMKDKDVRLPLWVDVKTPQPINHGSIG
ncbi:S2-RNase [Pyrus ussuriensis x Pyrus communis]|uniref:S2-RNase n=1 Tax=Pyrus ussuriensis x Pyrus communis TaxID=2448454 RepID=A0A5N5HSI6_9ROSA|nr:S2-RNase [Pyrus ussuriensis x Pyrus communis]